MLNQLELKAYYERENIQYEAQGVINHIRRSNPSRRTVSGMYNVACRYPSKKMGCVIQAESHHNELAALYEWDHDCITHEFYDQPPKIKLSYQKINDKKVTVLHTPDFLYWLMAILGGLNVRLKKNSLNCQLVSQNDTSEMSMAIGAVHLVNPMPPNLACAITYAHRQ